MKTRENASPRRILLVLAPAVLILASAGTLAWPNLQAMKALRNEEAQVLATLDEAQRIFPQLSAWRQAEIDAADVVRQWLDEAVPHTHSPRLFLLDIKLAEQTSGIRVKSCHMRSDDPLPRDTEPDGSSKGSLWDLKLYGTFAQVLAFVRNLQGGDRLYTVRRVHMQRTKKGRIKMNLRVFVHGLTPRPSREGSEQ